MRTHYDLLNVPPTASAEVIQQQWQQISRMDHPDTNGGVPSPRYLSAQYAWEVLSNPQSRAEYNRSIGLNADGTQAPGQLQEPPRPEWQHQPAESGSRPEAGAAQQDGIVIEYAAHPGAPGAAPPIVGGPKVPVVPLVVWAVGAVVNAAMYVALEGGVPVWLIAMNIVVSLAAILAARYLPYGVAFALLVPLALNLINPVFAVFTVVVPVIGFWLALREQKRVAPRDAVSAEETQMDIFGAGTDLAEVFGSAGVRGAEGEAITTRMIEQHLRPRFPGLKVYHGLRFAPGSNADMDHALVYGSRIFLIDSKMYAGNRRYLFRDGEEPLSVICDVTDLQGYFVDHREMKLAKGPEIWASSLPRAVVAAGVLIHTDSGRAEFVDQTSSPVAFGDAQHILNLAAQWLCDQPTPVTVDRRLMKDLHVFFLPTTEGRRSEDFTYVAPI